MNKTRLSQVCIIFILINIVWLIPVLNAYAQQTDQLRVYIVSSYHKAYLWSQDTAKGVGEALIENQLIDNDQLVSFLEKDYLESSQVVLKKAWMNTKRKNSKGEIADHTAWITKDIHQFKPDVLLLGDDNAANYIGNQFIDSNIPVVFWGINGVPLKYGLIESLEKPGHNVTGVYQAGYLKENVHFLKKLVPKIKTMAIVSDDSPTGRSKVKQIEDLAARGELPVQLVGTVMTNSFGEWKAQTLQLNQIADSFFIVNHNTLKDSKGKSIDQMVAGKWYLNNIKKPDCAHERQFAQEGVLLVVDDSGFKQGYEAMKLAISIVQKGLNPANIPVYAPLRGPVIINRQRAQMLKINISELDFVEEYIDKAMALEK